MASDPENEAFIPGIKDDETLPSNRPYSEQPATSWRSFLSIYKFAASGLVVFSLAILLIIVSLSATRTSSGKQDGSSNIHDESKVLPSYQGQEDCGVSPTEARARGCVFDAVLLGWVPWRCHDAQLASSFLRQHQKKGDRDWKFYIGANKTASMTPAAKSPGVAVSFTDLLQTGDFDELYAEFEFLLLHCSYTRRKTQNTAVLGEILDGYSADPHQSAHCEMWSLWRTALDDVSTVTYNKYITCPRTHRDVGKFGWYRVVDGKKIYRQST